MPRSRKWCHSCYEQAEDVGTISKQGLCKGCAIKRVVASLIANYPEDGAAETARQVLATISKSLT